MGLTAQATAHTQAQSLQIHHPQYAAHTAHSAQSHNNTNANLTPPIQITVHQHTDWYQNKREVRHNIDNAIQIPRCQQKSGRQTLRIAGFEQGICELRRVPALEERDEDIEEAVCCADGEDDVEYERLPALCEDAKEEEAERDFEEGGCENVEGFGELN
jgi:hypothetical protein